MLTLLQVSLEALCFQSKKKLISYSGSLMPVHEGNKINLLVHLNSLQFDVNHSPNFVLESQIDMTCYNQKKIFTMASILCNDEKTYKIAFMHSFANKKRLF